MGIRQRKDCLFGPRVSFQERGEKHFECPPVKDSQRWLQSESDNDGWFTFKNLVNGKLLTAIDKNEFVVRGTPKFIFSPSLCTISTFNHLHG